MPPKLSSPPPKAKPPVSHKKAKPALVLPPPPSSKGKAAVSLAPRAFTFGPWNADHEGEKTIIYAPPGMGKSTLAMMMPKPVFLGLDDGARKLKHPVTGERPVVVSDPQTGQVVNTWEAVRNVLAQPDLFSDFKSLVIDTGTRLEELCVSWVMENVKTEKGASVTELEDYGWGKGYRHVFDHMQHPLTDLDELVRRGINVTILCHQKFENMESGEYRRTVPEFQIRNESNVCNRWCGWCDNVFKIDHCGMSIDAKKRKAISTGGYAVFVHPINPGYVAKARTISIETPVISFESPEDNSIWIELFGEGYDDV